MKRRKLKKCICVALKAILLCALCFIIVIWALLFNATQINQRYSELNKTYYAGKK